MATPRTVHHQHEAINPVLISKTKAAVQALFPIDANGTVIDATNVQVDLAGFDPGSLNAWEDAKAQGKTLGARIKADMTMSRGGKVVQRLRNFNLGTLPLVGAAFGTFMVQGADYFAPNQLRLKPGAYTREKTNGDFETFMPMKGAQMKLHLEPESGVLKLEVFSSNVRWYNIVRALGATDEDIVTAWGNDKRARELLELNKTKSITGDVTKLFKAVAEHKQNRDLVRAGVVERDTRFDDLDEAGRVAYLKEWFAGKELDGYATRKTLGKEITRAGVELLLAASKRLVAVSRGDERPDERDAIEYKTIHGVEDLIPERVARLGRMLKNKVVRRLSKKEQTIAKAFGQNWLGPATLGFFGGSGEVEGGLSHTAEAANPLAILSEHSKLTPLGEGGIGSERAVTTDARLFRPGNTNYVDPSHTPEGSQVGLTTHLAATAFKDGNTIKSLFRSAAKGKLGEMVELTAEQANDATIGFPEDWFSGKATGSVRAIRGGEIIDVPATEVEYVPLSGASAFGHTSNAALFLAHTHPNRAMMAGKHLTQALPLVHREMPLVNLKTESGKDVYESLGNRFTVRSTVDGTVEKVTDRAITVSGVKHEILDHYPMQAKVAFHHEAVVKVGDRVKKGDLLADNNYSRNGKLALGVNVRTAYLPWKNGLTYEDAITISDSAAKKFTSSHNHHVDLEKKPGLLIGTKLAQAQFPTRFTAESIAALGPNGVIKDGSKVVPGQVLIAAVSKNEYDATDTSATNLASIHKKLIQPYRDAIVVWNEDFPGVVRRVIETPSAITVHLTTEEPARVGDKLSMSSAAKGTIASIIPDDKMPRTKAGDHIEVVLNPHGIVNRINPSQIIEQAAGKLAKATGKKLDVVNFDGKNYAAIVKQGLTKAGLKHAETIFDPETGKWTEHPVGVGYHYMFKLDHPVRKKFSARERDGYTQDEIPTRGRGVGGQPYDHLTTYALLGHNAHNLLSESAGIRGTKHDEFWHAYQAGEAALPLPKTPFAFEKFKTLLNAAGVQTVQKGDVLHYLPMTDQAVKAMSHGEITEPTAIRSKDLASEKGGLFDPEITGGLAGDRAAHVKLHERIPHPLYEKPLRDVTGLKTADFYGLISHTRWFDPRKNEVVDAPVDGGLTGTKAFESLLDFDVDERLREAKRKLKTAVGSDANKLNRSIRYLRGLKEAGLKPSDAYLTQYVPVIPPKFRPIVEMHNGDLRVADANLLYRDLILTNKALASAKNAGMPDEHLVGARRNLFESFGALIGVNNSLTHRDDREDAKGFIDIIKGVKNKEGLFQRLVVAHRNDYSGRSTVEPDAGLGVDEIAIPEDMAWKIYKPIIVRKLSQTGWGPAEAAEQVEKRTLAARQVLEAEMKERPVLMNRAPSLHRWSVMAAFPRFSEGKEIKVSPLSINPLGADFDGDTHSIIVPVTDAAKREAHGLLPSRNLIYDRNRALAYDITKDAISGVFELTKSGSPSGKTYASADEAIAAYQANRDSLRMTSQVTITGRKGPQPTIGWLVFEQLVPERFRVGVVPPIDGKKLNAIMTTLAKSAPADFNNITRRLVQAGFNSAAASGAVTATIDELVIDRSKVNRLLDQLEKDVKAGKTKLEQQEILMKNRKAVDTELTTIMKDHLKATGTGYAGFMDSGSNNKVDALRQAIISPVAVADVYGQPVPAIIKSSYGSGMNLSDFILASPGARKGLVDRALSTARPGFLGKEVAGNVGNVRIAVADCGTTNGLEMPLNEPDIDLLDRHLLRDVGGFKRNDTVTPAMLAQLRDKKIQSIWVRSPLTCQADSPPCQLCAGRDAQGALHPIGANIGYNYGQALAERGTNATLKSFHSGGTLGSGNFTGFDRIVELLKFPDVIHNQGTVATTGGRVESVKPAPQGGTNIVVDGVTHYAGAGRKVLVSAGDKIERGTALTDGALRPQDLAEHRSLLDAQRYVVDELRTAYGDDTIRKPVLEVAVAATMRTVEITDDGGEHALAKGDILPETQAMKIKARNAKVQYKPVLLGLSYRPLESRDLMERLNFQRIEDSIRDIGAGGGKSDLTGSASPIAGLAFGAKFRAGQNIGRGFDTAVMDSAFHQQDPFKNH